MGFILYKVNHSYWFDHGSFHINTIEGVQSKIKRISNKFSGLSGNTIAKLLLNGENVDDYFNGWICYTIFQINCDNLKLGIDARKEYLSKFIS